MNTVEYMDLKQIIGEHINVYIEYIGEGWKEK